MCPELPALAALAGVLDLWLGVSGTLYDLRGTSDALQALAIP